MSLQGQDLKTTVNEILDTNPVILERLKNYNATKQDVESAKAGFYPTIDISIGTGTERTDKTNLAKSAPDTHTSFSVYQTSITYAQNIFNGFSTNYQVKEQEYKTLSAAYSYIEKVNDRVFVLTQQYIEVIKNRELVQNSQENVKIDKDIFTKVNKLYDAGLTTLSEVNKIESSLALAKSNLIVQENTLLNAEYKLQTILGRELDPNSMEEPTLNDTLPQTREEAAEFAIQNNPSLLVSTFNIKLAHAVNREKKSVFYPKIDIQISQSMNKNLSAVQGNNDAFKAMAFISYNLFNGYADTVAVQRSISSLQQEVESKNILRRQVIEGLNLAFTANEKLQEQMIHLKEYAKYSLKTLTLYTKEYDLGRRSLLDLLSAQNDFIGSKAQIINTKYSILFAKYRILDAMGILVDTILGDKNSAYSSVGLSTKTATYPKDTLPINYDRDNDLIVDAMDLCSNSISTELKNIYGCKLHDANVAQIERYNAFLFVGKKLQDTKRLQNLFKQLKPYGLSKIKFKILGNAQNEDLTKGELLNLSRFRAKSIANTLIKLGVRTQNITTYANAGNAPMYNGVNAHNNRVDIIVTKLK